MKKYKLVLFDVDGTLLDFEKSEREGMKKTLKQFGLRNDDVVIDAYQRISESYWKMFERGKMTKERLLMQRHQALFEKFGFERDVSAFRKYYEGCISESCELMAYALDILMYIKSEKTCETAIITNGSYDIQRKRIARSKLDAYFDHIYISEQVGYNKPRIEIFEYIFDDIGGEVRKTNTLIVGDSLTADIKGGNNAGIDTCWYNPKRQKNEAGVKVDYEIQSLLQLKEIF